MRVFFGLPAPRHQMPTALAIGNFDGVHLGHQALLKQAVHEARLRYLQPAALTFEPHPRERVGEQAPSRISTLYDKIENILKCGIERVYVLPFNDRFRHLTAENFVQSVLLDGIDAHWVTVGEDFRFGCDRTGDAQTLERMRQERHFEFYVTPTLIHAGERVSSTRVRRELEAGHLRQAADLLGRNFSMTGRVIHGAALGRQLGFPTLNMAAVPPGSPARPAVSGVFAVRIYGLNRAWLHGVASIGRKPTVVSNGRYLLETHVFDWKGDAYGKVVRVEFIEKLRDEKKFNGLDELTAQIQADSQAARQILGYSL